MELPYVNKVANRNRICSEADQLRSKITNETAEIIKLKVAQDAAYWELNEKYKQLECNHERLQQNMLEVQMQHENISGQYQDELRLRPETLNKISSAHEMRVALEAYAEQLKVTLCRTRSDQATLCEAYNKSGQIFSELTGKVERIKEKYQTESNNLKQEITLREEHALRMSELFNSSKQEAGTMIKELKEKLDETLKENMVLICNERDHSKNAENQQQVLKQRESTILTLQSDMKQLLQEFEAQCNRMKQDLQQKDAKIKDLNDSHEDVQKALIKQEEISKSAIEKGNRLQEKFSALEVEHEATKSAKSELEMKKKELQVMLETRNADNKTLCEQKEKTLRLMAEHEQKISSLKEQLQTTEDQVKVLETDKENIMIEVGNLKIDINNKTIVINNMELENAELVQKVTALEQSLEECRTHSETMLASRNETVEHKMREIGKLMTELKNNIDAKSKIQLEVDQMRADIERERDIGRDKDKQIDKLQTSNKENNEELAKITNTVLELRVEKQNLQEKIENMQQTIDSVKQQLSAANMPKLMMDHQDAPEQDNNFMEPPARQGTPIVASKLADRQTFRMPAAKALPTSVYDIFSDSSADDNELDPNEVTRRFDMLRRGESISHLPLATLKRGYFKSRTNELPTSQAEPNSHLSSKEKMAVKHKKRAEQSKRLKKSEDGRSSFK